MEYPGSHIIRPIRRALLITFITLFFVICPILIMYTTGYRYDWQNGLLKETGVISIDVLPTKAEAYLNGLAVKKSIPIRLKNLTPQKYNLKLSLAGYYDWEKEVEVKNRQTIYIKEISLLKKPEPKFLLAGTINYISLSDNGQWLIYTNETKGKTNIWLDDLNNNSQTLIKTLPGIENIKVDWGKRYNYIAISNAQAPFRWLITVNAENPTQTWDIGSIASSLITKYAWQENLEPQLFFSTETKINAAQIISQKIIDIAPNKYLDWQMDGNKIWTLTWNVTTTQMVLTKDIFGFSTEFAHWQNDTNTRPSDWHLLAVYQDTLLLKNNKQADKFLLVDKDNQYSITGQNWLISPYNDWWIFWTPWEINTYSAGSAPILLNRYSEKLGQIIPLDEFNTLGIFWANRVTALFPYYSVSHDLLNETTVARAVDSQNKIMYFSGKILLKEGLWKINY